ncbi:hypothetical protein Poli38472_014054 [Pythium oligandrum]|uniref:Fucosyltransferase n=1 Tax=Pythium oligandrum TaxID=41045 RepID=A0A8K1CNC9_PYTOL|nr:hypothetical protein Poli38472_014054 [Pythium oligandrum]|eukprot:TMW66742.1 hypothetical protein Poli38472_014054 [Pythium oligandrum]
MHAWLVWGLVGGLTAAYTLGSHRQTHSTHVSDLNPPLDASEWTIGPALDSRDLLKRPTSNLNSDDQQNHAFLLIGVKTRAVKGFVARQAIRDTWASPAALPSNVRVLFVGCHPDLSEFDPSIHMEIQSSIAQEKAFYGDLLTDELQCRDAYLELVAKTVTFLHYATSHWDFTYVMMADDDIYLRVDRLVELLKENGDHKRYYAGDVSAIRMTWPQSALRDPTHPNYVSEEVYPMRHLPPFASGPHYILSVDCASFITRNRHDLRGVGTLEDVSVGLWMLGMQIHPRHLTQFHQLRSGGCRNALISLADLEPSAIRQIHANLCDNAPFCRHFGFDTWLKLYPEPPPPLLPTEAALWDQLDVTWNVEYYGETRSIEVQLALAHPNLPNILDAKFDPSAAPFHVICSGIDAILQQSVSISHFCMRFRNRLRPLLSNIIVNNPPSRPHLALLNHSFHGDVLNLLVILGYSKSAVYAKIIMECLFATMYPRVQLGFLTEDAVQEYNAVPDVFVLAVFDQHRVTEYMAEYKESKLIMISGEAWDIPDLPDNVVLITTVQNVDHPRQVYLPHASASFGERTRHSPLALLQPNLLEDQLPRRFCAYIYARCDRPHREYMYDLLNEIEPVDALGACQGASRPSNTTRLAGRRDPFYNDEAVEIYKAYKFVIAFENANVPGYVTEKLVNAFLAGSIPIFYGHSVTVQHIFNRRSFIDCGEFTRLRDCAEYVHQVYRSPGLYEQLRREPPISNVTAFHELFSWHPDVESSFQANRLRVLLNEV